MKWFLFRKDSFSYVVFELQGEELVRKISFHDDRGHSAQWLIDEAKEVIDQSTIQQIIYQCKAVKF